MSYTLTVGCPLCAGPLRHVSGDTEQWTDRLGAVAVCVLCGCRVEIIVEITWKDPRRKGAAKMTKLPLEPLMKLMGCATANELGAMTGLSRDAVLRLKSQGVPIHRADELAVMCGVHAAEVWGADFYQVLELQGTA